MISFPENDGRSLDRSVRDGVGGLADTPLVVSISDLHGYLGAARSALRTVGDHPDYDPIVEADAEGRLHWAGGEEYVLVFNGDLVDRGPDNDGVVDLVERLSREAPDGHVRVMLGNHEWGALFPALVHWPEWYSGQQSAAERRRLCQAVVDGDVVAAYEGYNFTYAHAGLPNPYRPGELNDALADAAGRLQAAVGTDEDAAVQRAVVDDHRTVLGTGRQGGRGLGAGIVWLDFRFLPADSPPQVVGHTRQDQPVQKGNVVCENVIRANRSNPGGEAVVVESPDGLRSLERTSDGGVHTSEFRLPSDPADRA